MVVFIPCNSDDKGKMVKIFIAAHILSHNNYMTKSF